MTGGKLRNQWQENCREYRVLRAGRLGEYEFVRPGPAFSCIDTAMQTAEWRKSDEDVITGKRSIRKRISWQRNCDWKVKGRKDSSNRLFYYGKKKTAETGYL